MKTIIIIISSIALMILATLNGYAQTATEPLDGNGTEASPYEINDQENLYWISQNNTAWDKHFIQTADIDASETKYWNDAKGWFPIGNDSIAFTGTYNGKNHIISGLYINRPSQNNVGLFGYISNLNSSYTIKKTTINNVGLININITGNKAVGSLIGSVSGGENIVIENCFVSLGSVKGAEATGGLIGELIGSNLNADLKSNPVLRYSYANINIESRTEINIRKEKFGGLVGSLSKAKISNSYSRGSINVTGSSMIGGITGSIENGGKLNYTYSAVKINAENCQLIGGLSGSKFNTEKNHGFIQNSFYDLEVSGIYNYNNTDKDFGKTSKEMKSAITFIGWFGYHWKIDQEINDGYPYLIFNNSSLKTTLISHNAVQKQEHVIIEWVTISENHNTFFEVEKTTNGYFYETVASVAGSGPCNELHFYMVIDINPSNDIAFYRLSQKDVDGNIEYFPLMPVLTGDKERDNTIMVFFEPQK